MSSRPQEKQPDAAGRMPVTLPRSHTSSSALNASRTSAPAARAASTRIESSTVRRGLYRASTPS